MTRRWYEFSAVEVVIIVVILIGIYWLREPPEGWHWLLVAPSLLLGKLLVQAVAYVYRRKNTA